MRSLGTTLPAALLEDWMRENYFSAEVDIGSSGVQEYSFAELRSILDIPVEAVDQIIFYDSPTLGSPPLRRAIASRYADGNADCVIVTHGSSEAIFLVMHALLSEGDEVVVANPCYQQLASTASSLGCRLKLWTLRPEQGFQPNIDDARRLIGPRTRMVIVNFPHNPTGVTLDRTQQRELIDLCAAVGAYLVWDAAFAELVYNMPLLNDPVTLYERAISLGTLSKAYGLPGLRIGWCIATPEVIELFVRLRDYTTLHLSPLVEMVAQRAVEFGDRLVAPRLAQASRNRSFLADWVVEQNGLVQWFEPQGGVTAFLHLPGTPDVQLCQTLIQKEKVLLVPGTCFGCPDHVRVGFGKSSGSFQRGLESLSSLLRSQHFTEETPNV